MKDVKTFASIDFELISIKIAFKQFSFIVRSPGQTGPQEGQRMCLSSSAGRLASRTFGGLNSDMFSPDGEANLKPRSDLKGFGEFPTLGIGAKSD